ncbi:VOC family protein [Rufibacter sp. LB8]|uniref:VOC family protein n=1 Tax=Rufibacter sp. LB8 TaxID=2777781 RepID=UPI00178C4E54|nr:VOC family protein [Rufibacter sp. LB8]
MDIQINPSQKITPFLWFNGRAEEAMGFYTSIFQDSYIKSMQHMGPVDPNQSGSMVTGTFVLAGQEFMALDGGPMYQFTPALSFFVNCQDQAEVDELWEKLSAGGREDRCGWLQDKFGVSWQIIPEALGRLLHGSDRQAAGRVLQAMLKMQKIDVAALERAYAGES